MAIIQPRPVNLQQFAPQPAPPNFGERLFGGIGDGVAQIYAAIQKQKDNEYRDQQLAQQGQQQAALAEYYQGQIETQRSQNSIAAAAAARKATAERQVGEALRRAMGGGVTTPSSGGMAPAPQIGNQLQAGAGVQSQLGSAFQQAPIGNRTQMGAGMMTPQFASRSTEPLAIPGYPTTGQAVRPDAFTQVFGVSRDDLEPEMQALLEGVDPENIPGVIEGLQQLQALQPKPADALKPTGNMQDFLAWTQLSGIDPRHPQAVEMFRSMIARQTGTTVNVNGGKPSAFDEKWGETAATGLAKTKEGANTAFGGFGTIAESWDLVSQGKVITGFAAKERLKLARAFQASGAVIPGDWAPGKDAVADTQTLLRLNGDQVLTYLRGRELGSGTAVSDGDRLFMEQMAGRDISLDKETLQRIMRINMGVGIEKVRDAARELRAQAEQNPGSAHKLLRDAEALEKRLLPHIQMYGKMIGRERGTAEDVNKRARSLPGYVQ